MVCESDLERNVKGDKVYWECGACGRLQVAKLLEAEVLTWRCCNGDVEGDGRDGLEEGKSVMKDVSSHVQDSDVIEGLIREVLSGWLKRDVGHVSGR